MKQKFIDAYMDVAERFAQLSSAVRLQVGAIVVKDDRIILLATTVCLLVGITIAKM
jgi:deoxycytidylate deaminase